MFIIVVRLLPFGVSPRNAPSLLHCWDNRIDTCVARYKDSRKNPYAGASRVAQAASWVGGRLRLAPLLLRGPDHPPGNRFQCPSSGSNTSSRVPSRQAVFNSTAALIGGDPTRVIAQQPPRVLLRVAMMILALFVPFGIVVIQTEPPLSRRDLPVRRRRDPDHLDGRPRDGKTLARSPASSRSSRRSRGPPRSSTATSALPPGCARRSTQARSSPRRTERAGAPSSSTGT